MTDAGAIGSRLVDEVARLERLRSVAEHRQQWSRVDALDEAISEARSTYGNALAMTEMRGKLARIK